MTWKGKLTIMAMAMFTPFLCACAYVVSGITGVYDADTSAVGVLVSLGSYFVLMPVLDMLEHICFINEEEA